MKATDIITNTSQWSLVIHKVTNDSAEIWVGTLFPTLKKPSKARVELFFPDGSRRTKNINTKDWQRPFKKVNQRFYTLCKFTRLQPNTRFSVTFSRYIEPIKDTVSGGWQELRSGQFDTLPERIPLKGKKSFTVGLGSCFYEHRDGGQAAASYKALYARGTDSARPDITFLTGDQVYLDIGFDSLSFISDEIRQRVADDYAKHWQALGSILNRGGTWMLPDDHEFWNDYPFYDSLIPTLFALKIKHVRETWTKTAKDAVTNIQRTSNLDIFSIGQDISFAVADLRSNRKDNRFIAPKDLKQLTEWAKNLTSPGVLVTSQPLIVEEENERNLLSFKNQYAELLQALAHSGHDILLLSGDVHFGRIATVNLGNNGARLVEVIASPMSNLTGLNGLSTAEPISKPKYFPEPGLITIPGWKPALVNYNSDFNVSTKKGFLLSAYPKKRTREHFMTVSFNRNNNGEILLLVDAWRVRERSGTKNLPVKDFKKSFKFTLK